MADTRAEDAKRAVRTAVLRVVDAEGWLEDATRLYPEQAQELNRLHNLLHDVGVQMVEVSRVITDGQA